MSHPFLDGRLSLCTSHSLTSVLDVLNDYFLSNHILIYFILLFQIRANLLFFPFLLLRKKQNLKEIGEMQEKQNRNSPARYSTAPLFQIKYSSH